jgi:hypothetical protein
MLESKIDQIQAILSGDSFHWAIKQLLPGESIADKRYSDFISADAEEIGEVMPELDGLPEDMRQTVLEIERLHKGFHACAKNLTCPYTKTDINALHQITDFLIINLTKLDRKVKALVTT